MVLNYFIVMALFDHYSRKLFTLHIDLMSYIVKEVAVSLVTNYYITIKEKMEEYIGRTHKDCGFAHVQLRRLVPPVALLKNIDLV